MKKSLTLIEILIAMVIFSVISVVGINLVRIGTNSYSTAKDHSQVLSTAEEILKKIRYDVENAKLVSVTDSGNTLVITKDDTNIVKYIKENNLISKKNGTTKIKLTDDNTISKLLFSTPNDNINKYINIELKVYQNSFGQTNEVEFKTGFCCKK